MAEFNVIYWYPVVPIRSTDRALLLNFEGDRTLEQRGIECLGYYQAGIYPLTKFTYECS
ncbi:hypothetical protein [Chamaesiphon polymorphus]|uniref:hypothetical protein n=1 Tax=Chamaesiphon polymorphus TaxID=2107691 RepID=UPI0015E682F3|nr:hypothetical protein [Chamaesiphon polymorphus]